MVDIASPAPLDIAGGALRTSRIAPARLRIVGGDVVTSRDSAVSSAASVPKLDRLRRFDKLIEGEQVSPRMQLIWQQTMEAIEGAFAAVNQRVDDNSAILARLTAAEALAEAANDNAVAAKATAEAVETATQQTFTQIDPTYGESFNERIDIP